MRLIDVFRIAGADVISHTVTAGHEIVSLDIDAARQWIARISDSHGPAQYDAMPGEMA